MAFLKQGKTNWKYILIVLILAFIVGGGILWWITRQEIPLVELPEIEKPQETGCDWKPTKDYGNCTMLLGVYYNGKKCEYISGCSAQGDVIPFQSMEECQALCEGAKEIYSIIDEINFIGETSIKEYEIGSAKFVIFPKIYKEETKEYLWGYFEAYDKDEKIYTSEPVYAISDLFAFEYQNNKHIILSEYSGGAHCCFQEYIFVLDTNNNLKIIKILPLGNAHITKTSLLVKNGKLYLVIKDDRFAYFHTAYAASYFFNQYFSIHEDNLIESNANFKQEYIEEAINCENDLNKRLLEDESQYIENWFPLLVCKVVNYIAAGETEKAWGEFEAYFAKVVELDPQTVKEEVIEMLGQERF
ncbi:hypothetical protein KJA16_03385 [Patescibacteria group bacterium]|nr:hypothetical protein [Patescibacteria group bacterium]